MLECSGSISVVQVDAWSAAVAACRFDADDTDPDLLALVESAERLKDACAALQARATHEYSERRLAALTVGSRPDRAARRDIGARIARARRVSPTHGGRYLELARMLVRDLPCTLDALAAGHTNEYRAGLIAHSAACLGTADRAALDADLGPRLTGKGNRAVQAEADRIACELDAPAVLERHRRAAEDRRVTLRPAPDTMTYLTALLPVADGVATWAVLDRHATLAKAAGDHRTRGQLMVDELAQRLLTGTPSQPAPTGTTPTGMTPTGTTPTGRPGPVPVPVPTVPPDCRVPAPRTAVRPTPTAPDQGERPDQHPTPPRPCPPATGKTAAGEPATGEPGTVDPATREPATGEPATGEPAAVESGAVEAATVEPDTSPPATPDTAGQAPPAAPPPPPAAPPPPALPPVRQIDLMLVMTDRTLLDSADTAAVIPGYGPVPAALARGMLADADPATRIFLRRLYTDPTGTQLLTADARGRLFPHAVRQFVLARDQRCRNPYCDAPIRHIDHTVPHSAGGPTSQDNNDGLCELCSLTKAARTDTDIQPGPPPLPPRSAPWATPTDADDNRRDAAAGDPP